MDEETLNELESLLLEAKDRAKVVYDGLQLASPGHTAAYYIHSDICKAIAHLRSIKSMNV